MHEPTVYEILNQTHKGNKQSARLLHALEELAGRLEVGRQRFKAPAHLTAEQLIATLTHLTSCSSLLHAHLANNQL
jgi:hypothetical protein